MVTKRKTVCKIYVLKDGNCRLFFNCEYYFSCTIGYELDKALWKDCGLRLSTKTFMDYLSIKQKCFYVSWVGTVLQISNNAAPWVSV